MKWIRRLWCSHGVNELIHRKNIDDVEMLLLRCVECGKFHFKSYGVEE